MSDPKDTPEQRASRVLRDLASHNIELDRADGAALHSLVAAEIVGALSDARDCCINIQDRIRIGGLMMGPTAVVDRRETPREDALTQAIADLPPGGTLPCVICGGDAQRKQGCPGCHGAGIHTVSRAIEEGNDGVLAVKPCGCAVEWYGNGVDANFLAQRREIWNTLGYRTESAAWSPELQKRLTESAGCKH